MKTEASPVGSIEWLLRGAIRAYQLFLAPALAGQCRFHPSCSEYARLAILRFGPAEGGWLAFRRLARCHPWHEGGVDEVPDRPSPPARRVLVDERRSP